MDHNLFIMLLFVSYLDGFHFYEDKQHCSGHLVTYLHSVSASSVPS
jgi:hypothetical protein